MDRREISFSLENNRNDDVPLSDVVKENCF